MDLKVFAMIFATIFVAELGDKSQLAAMLFSADKGASKLTVFLAVSLALVVASAIGVAAGTLLSGLLSEKVLARVAGVGFILIGAFTLYRAGGT